MVYSFTATPDEILANHQAVVEKARRSSSLIFLVEDDAHFKLVKKSIIAKNYECFVVESRKNVDQCLMMFKRCGVSVLGLIDDDGRGYSGIENDDLIFKTDYWDGEASVLMTSIFGNFLEDFLEGIQLDASTFLNEIIKAAAKVGTLRKAALNSNYAAKFEGVNFSDCIEINVTRNAGDRNLAFSIHLVESRLEALISPPRHDPTGKTRFNLALEEIRGQIKKGKIELRNLCHGKDLLKIIELCGMSILPMGTTSEAKFALYRQFSPRLLNELRFLRDMDAAASEF